MTPIELVVHVNAAIALAGICYRLTHLRPCRASWRSQALWHVWVVAHVLIGVGLLAALFRLSPWPAVFISTGLAVYFGVQWHRRSDET